MKFISVGSVQDVRLIYPGGSDRALTRKNRLSFPPCRGKGQPKCQLSTINYQLSTINYQLSTINYQLSTSQAEQFLSTIDHQIWSNQLKRKVQHYGYKYDDKKRLVDASMNLGALPNWVQDLARRFYLEGLTETIPDQAIANEYLPAQGIASHIDCVPCFGNTIISLSLGGTCVMEFTRAKTKEKIPVLLLPRSIMILQGAARYEWQHGIAARKTDKYQGREFVRSRRVSLTFRKVLFSEQSG